MFVGPDLGPNCLLKLSADNTSRQRVNSQTAFTGPSFKPHLTHCFLPLSKSLSLHCLEQVTNNATLFRLNGFNVPRHLCLVSKKNHLPHVFNSLHAG